MRQNYSVQPQEQPRQAEQEIQTQPLTDMATTALSWYTGTIGVKHFPGHRQNWHVQKWLVSLIPQTSDHPWRKINVGTDFAWSLFSPHCSTPNYKTSFQTYICPQCPFSSAGVGQSSALHASYLLPWSTKCQSTSMTGCQNRQYAPCFSASYGCSLQTLQNTSPVCIWYSPDKESEVTLLFPFFSHIRD